MNMMSITKFIALYFGTAILLTSIIPRIVWPILVIVVGIIKPHVQLKHELLTRVLDESSGGVLNDCEKEDIITELNETSKFGLLNYTILSYVVWPLGAIAIYVAMFKTIKHALTDEPDGSN